MNLKFWGKSQKSLSSDESKLYEDLNQQLEEQLAQGHLTSSKALSSTKDAASVPDYSDKASLQRLFLTEGWLYIAVSTIAKQIAQLPMDLKKRVIQVEEMAQPDGTMMETQKETWLDANNQKYIKPWRVPNEDMDYVQFISLLIIDLLSTGEAYIYRHAIDKTEDEVVDRLRRAMGKNKAEYTLHRISSPTMSIKRHRETGYIAGYTMTSEDGQFFFKKSEVIKISMPNPCDPDSGLAPIVPVLKKLMLDKYNTEHLIRFFKQGARLGGVIKTTKNLTKEQVSRLERTFEANYTGKTNFHRTMILPNGMDYDTIESSPSDSNIQQVQDSNKEQILSAYGLPPVKVGLLDGASFANASVQNKTFYQDTVIPLLAQFLAAVNHNGTMVEGKEDLRFDFNTSGVEALQQDSVERGDVARGMVATGLSINEVRQRVWNLGAIEGGHIVPAIHKLMVAEAYSGASGEGNSPEDNNGQQDGEDGVVGGQNRNDDPNEDPAPNPEDNGKSAKSVNDASNAQNDTEALSDVSDSRATFEERVMQLTQNAVGQGIELGVAMRSAITQALSEGFTPVQDPTDDEKSIEQKKNLEKFGEEYLAEYQKSLTGEDVDPLISKKFDAATNLFKGQGERISSMMKSQKSLKHKEALLLEAEIELALVPTKSEFQALTQAEALLWGIASGVSLHAIGVKDSVVANIVDSLATKLIVGVNNTTKEKVLEIILKARDTDGTIFDTAKALEEYFATSSGRAMTIARTETLADVSFGQEIKRQAIKLSVPSLAPKMKKMWITARDSRVRDGHDVLDGEVVGIDGTFSNGLQFPRDRRGKASEVVNCRCTIIDYLVDDEESIADILDVDLASTIANELLESYL